MGDIVREMFLVDVDADARHGVVKAVAGDAVLGEVARELVIAHVHVVGPLDEHFRHVLGQENAGGGREPEVEDELIGGGQPRVETDAGEDVRAARAVPRVGTRAAPRRLVVRINSPQVGHCLPAAAKLPQRGHEVGVGRGGAWNVMFH